LSRKGNWSPILGLAFSFLGRGGAKTSVQQKKKTGIARKKNGDHTSKLDCMQRLVKKGEWGGGADPTKRGGAAHHLTRKGGVDPFEVLRDPYDEWKWKNIGV